MNYLLLNRIIGALLVLSIVILGFLSILTIWDVIKDDDVLWKSLTTSITVIIVGAVTLSTLKFLEDREKQSR